MKKTLSRRLRILGVIVLVAVVIIAVMALIGKHEMAFPHGNLEIERADGGRFSFDMKVAATQDEKIRGLMFYDSLPDDAGMIFLFDQSQLVDMWMKDTRIPLDMIFVRADGSIIKIATHTQPFSLAMINSEEPVKAVVEINAGGADERGIKPGDKVHFPGLGE